MSNAPYFKPVGEQLPKPAPRNRTDTWGPIVEQIRAVPGQYVEVRRELASDTKAVSALRGQNGTVARKRGLTGKCQTIEEDDGTRFVVSYLRYDEKVGQS